MLICYSEEVYGKSMGCLMFIDRLRPAFTRAWTLSWRITRPCIFPAWGGDHHATARGRCPQGHVNLFSWSAYKPSPKFSATCSIKQMKIGLSKIEDHCISPEPQRVRPPHFHLQIELSSLNYGNEVCRLSDLAFRQLGPDCNPFCLF